GSTECASAIPRGDRETASHRAGGAGGAGAAGASWSGLRPARGLLRPKALLILSREIGLGRPRVARDHARVEGPRLRLIAALLREDALLVERRRSARRLGIGLHDVIVHRRRGIGCRLFEAFTDIEQRIGRVIVGGEHAEEFPESQPGGGETAAPVLLSREFVHLVGDRLSSIARGTDRHGGFRLLCPSLASRPALGASLLGSSGELLI